MITAEGAALHVGSGGFSGWAKAWTLIASMTFWCVLLLLLFRSMVITPWREPAVIQGERMVSASIALVPQVERPIVPAEPDAALPATPPAQVSPLPSQTPTTTTASPIRDVTPTPSASIDRPTPNRGIDANPAPSSLPATRPVGPRIAGASPSGTPAPPGPATALEGRAGTLALLRARECLKVDIAERPPDCPPNDELLALARAALAKARDPQYRPENAEAFSRNELKWRGIPPPCLDDGETSGLKGGKLCVRFGNVPSKVRTWEEICEARGLGGCTRPDQAAVDRAVKSLKAAPPP